MSWEKAANIATVVEAIVVAVSIIFIWKQLRQQTKLTRIANTQALVGISSPFNLELIKDTKMAALWVRGSKDYDTFDEVGQYQYKSLLIWWLIFQENIFYQRKEGLLDEKIYASWDYDLRFFVTQQNLIARWGELKDAFQIEFRDYVTSLISCGRQPAPSQKSVNMGQPQDDSRVTEFHKRSGESHSEARKLLTAMAVGSLGVLYATLTGKDAPVLDTGSKWLALAAVVFMALAAGFGLAAWRADAAWAYKAANNFDKNSELVKPEGEPWHQVKRWCDRFQFILFGIGLLLTALLTLRLL